MKNNSNFFKKKKTKKLVTDDWSDLRWFLNWLQVWTSQCMFVALCVALCYVGNLFSCALLSYIIIY